MSSVVTDLTPEVLDCTKEMEWLKAHRAEYAGQWVALDGEHLIAHGTNSQAVREAARRSGIRLPLIVQVESDDLPFGGW
ncbi:MAG: DUF5678 domain-containing protein [Acidobacteriota bacterium]